MLDGIGWKTASEIPVSIGCMLVMNVFNYFVNLPFSLYSTFVVEQKHGFNKMTLGFYIKDQIKKFIVTQVIMMPILAGLIIIVHAGGEYFFFYLWLFCVIVMFFMMTIYPDFIAPLFDKYTPLPEGDLRSKIEELAASIAFPLKKLYVVDGSKRSAHSNAYFYGFWKNKRIVLFDTLIEGFSIAKLEAEEKAKKDKEEGKEEKEDAAEEKKDEATDEKPEDEEDKPKRKTGCNTDELLAVLGHELGHWKLNHMVKNILISQTNLFLMFGAFAVLYRHQPLYNAFGFYDEKPVLMGFAIIFQFVFSPYNELLNFMMTALSRRFEFQADQFSCELGKGEFLKSGLIKLEKDNLGFPLHDPLYSMWNYSHPTLIERMDAITDKKED